MSKSERISTHVLTASAGAPYGNGLIFIFPKPIENVTGWRVHNAWVGFGNPNVGSTSGFIFCSSLCPSQLMSTINGVPYPVIYSTYNLSLTSGSWAVNSPSAWNHWTKRDLTYIDVELRDQTAAPFIGNNWILTLEIKQTYD